MMFNENQIKHFIFCEIKQRRNNISLTSQIHLPFIGSSWDHEIIMLDV